MKSNATIRRIDSQHRVRVPSQFRNMSSSGWVVLMPVRDCTLHLYTEEVYNEFIRSKLNALSPSNIEDLKKLKQNAQTFKLQCDKQGRIHIPQVLIDFARLKDSVVFIESNTFCQLISEAKWLQSKLR